MALPTRSPASTARTFLQPVAPLPTGVPGFVGFATGGRRRRGRCPRCTGTKISPASIKPAVTAIWPTPSPVSSTNGGVRCYVVGADRHRATGTVAEGRARAARTAGGSRSGGGARCDDPAGERPRSACSRLRSPTAPQGNRLAILDAPGGRTPNDSDAVDDAQDVAPPARARQAEPVNGALYYPWLKVPSADSRRRPVAAAVRARRRHLRAHRRATSACSRRRPTRSCSACSIWRSSSTPPSRIASTPKASTACARFPAAAFASGARARSAATPTGATSTCAGSFLTLRRWIDLNMAWAAFEPNEPRLWVRIQRELNVYLGQLLAGRRAQGRERRRGVLREMRRRNQPAGRARSRAGVDRDRPGAASPAEFIVVRIIHRPGVADSSANGLRP